VQPLGVGQDVDNLGDRVRDLVRQALRRRTRWFPGRLCRRHGFFLGFPDDGLFGDKLFGRDGLAAFFRRRGFLCGFLLAGFFPGRAFCFP
jgi:hypothetical protein